MKTSQQLCSKSELMEVRLSTVMTGGFFLTTIVAVTKKEPSGTLGTLKSI